MKISHLLAGATAALVTGSHAWAERAPVPPDPPEVQALTKAFFDKIKSGKTDEAFTQTLKDSAQLMGAGSAQALSASTGAMIATFGGITDWTPLAKKTLAPTFIRETFYVRTAQAPLFFTLTFYKPEGPWRVVDIRLGTYSYLKPSDVMVEP